MKKSTSVLLWSSLAGALVIGFLLHFVANLPETFLIWLLLLIKDFSPSFL